MTDTEALAENLYKFLELDGKTPQGYGTWHLPRGQRPGKWMPAIEGKLEACSNGYHVMRLTDLFDWSSEHLYEVEVKGDRVDADNKVVVRQARVLRKVDGWNDRNLRLFACDCAERVLPIYEKQFPDEKRPRQAVEIARRFANGQATSEELAAARAAARDAAWDAARAAARAAAWDAARDAAWDAAWDAARAAARAAAWDAETSWQMDRLHAYLSGTTETEQVRS